MKKALLLAAGFGTRLRPLTDTIPKCLVPVKGKPLLGIWLERLSDCGIESFLVNTHYLPEQVRKFVENSPYRDKVTLIHEETLLGTAGTLAANAGFFRGEDDFLFLHADNYCTADFGEFFSAHRRRPLSCDMTMMTFRCQNPKSCGIVELDARGAVVGFHEKKDSPPGNLANGAVYLVGANMLDWILQNKVMDFSTEVIPRFMGRIFTYENKNVHIDIGDLKSLARANETS